MRKPAVDDVRDAAAVADQTRAVQVHDDATTAGALASVISAANGDTKVDELTGAGHLFGADGVATGTSTGVNAAQASSSLQQLDQREERVKKSVAYQHTVFHRFALDKLGKQYEKRMCSYCSAAFSFKGGTTSAALRHLKTSHADRLVYPGMNMAITQQLQQQLQLQIQLQDQQQKHHLEVQQQLYGATDATETIKVVEQDAGVTEKQPHSVGDQGAVSTPAPLPSSHNAEYAFNGDAGGNNDGAAQFVDHPAVGALHETMNGVAMAEATEEVGGHADENESETLPDEKHLLPKARQAAMRKRQRDDTDSSDAVNSNDSGDTNNAAIAPAKLLPPLTASQQAITHFLLHYKEMLSLPNRLRFVKHLTHHPSEAEMYNVLDAATQMEYVREFSDHATTI
ncbi:hypothetical protein Gpo141_00013426 [Globisporangium polare]